MNRQTSSGIIRRIPLTNLLDVRTMGVSGVESREAVVEHCSPPDRCLRDLDLVCRLSRGRPLRPRCLRVRPPLLLVSLLRTLSTEWMDWSGSSSVVCMTEKRDTCWTRTGRGLLLDEVTTSLGLCVAGTPSSHERPSDVSADWSCVRVWVPASTPAQLELIGRAPGVSPSFGSHSNAAGGVERSSPPLSLFDRRWLLPSSTVSVSTAGDGAAAAGPPVNKSDV